MTNDSLIARTWQKQELETGLEYQIYMQVQDRDNGKVMDQYSRGFLVGGGSVKPR